MVKANWGLKRHCPSCGGKYYDLGKNPSICPTCKYAYDITVPLRARRKAKPSLVIDKDDPLLKTKASIKKARKDDDADLNPFEDAEIEGDDEIEEIEEVDEIEVLEDLDDVDDDDDDAGISDDLVLDDDDVGDEILIDDLDDGVEEKNEKTPATHGKASERAKPEKKNARPAKAAPVKNAKKPASKAVKKKR